MRRVLLSGGGTGGHLYPALALADALRAEAPNVAVHIVGATRGVEARVLPQKGQSLLQMKLSPPALPKLMPPPTSGP